MSILITGGLGYIPSNTIESFLTFDKKLKYNQIVIVDNLSNSKIKVVDTLKSLHPELKCTVYTYDCCNYHDINHVFDENNITTIIHFAALKSVSDSIKKPLNYYNNNLQSLLNLLKIIEERKKSVNFIFSSSATVYGDTQSPLYESSHIGKGITNPYGQTKYMSECILKDFADVNSYFNCVILRYFNPVGGHSSGLLNEDGIGIPNNLMPYICGVAKGIYSKLTIFGDDYNTKDGTCERDFIHVTDLANAHYKAYKYLLEQHDDNYNIFNIGTGKATSVKELVETFERVCNVKINKMIGSRRMGDIPVTFCNCDKAKEFLNWKAEKTLEDMCIDSFASPR